MDWGCTNTRRLARVVFYKRSMNHQLLSGLTATLLITNLSGAPSSYADSTNPAESTQLANLVATDSAAVQEPTETAPDALAKVSATTSAPVAVPQSESSTSAVAEIYAHEISGRRAATLYVRSIPVLTFLSSGSAMGKQQSEVSAAQPLDLQTNQVGRSTPAQPSQLDGNFQFSQLRQDPVWRAMALATQLNYLNQQQVDAKTITVRWETDTNLKELSLLPSLNEDQRLEEQQRTGNQPSLVAGNPALQATSFPMPSLSNTENLSVPKSPSVLPPTLAGSSRQGRYVIQVGGNNLLVMDSTTILPDTTRNPAQDALQATNRLRRLMGNAPPLKEIAGLPRVEQQVVAYRTPKRRITGMASWYGPGFHGNYSANGEVFNQYALTAAHPSLPFGTLVRVTNLDNGRSVVVRINDRGPYAGGRIIDLSMGAAQVIGMVSSGVAQVNLEVLE